MFFINAGHRPDYLPFTCISLLGKIQLQLPSHGYNIVLQISKMVLIILSFLLYLSGQLCPHFHSHILKFFYSSQNTESLIQAQCRTLQSTSLENEKLANNPNHGFPTPNPNRTISSSFPFITLVPLTFKFLIETLYIWLLFSVR